MACADSAAPASVCTRTRLKSCPKRGSKRARTAGESGCPPDRSASRTLGMLNCGAGAPPEAGAAGVPVSSAAFCSASCSSRPADDPDESTCCCDRSGPAGSAWPRQRPDDCGHEVLGAAALLVSQFTLRWGENMSQLRGCPTGSATLAHSIRKSHLGRRLGCATQKWDRLGCA